MAACGIGVLTLGHFAHIAYFELSELDTLRQELRLDGPRATEPPGSSTRSEPSTPTGSAVLEQEIQQIQNGFYAVLSLSGLAVAIGLTGLLLAMVNPILLLLPWWRVPPLFAGRKAQAILDRSREEAAADTRLAMHFSGSPRAPDRPRNCASSGSRTRSWLATANYGSERRGDSGGPSSRP